MALAIEYKVFKIVPEMDGGSRLRSMTKNLDPDRVKVDLRGAGGGTARKRNKVYEIRRLLTLHVHAISAMSLPMIPRTHQDDTINIVSSAINEFKKMFLTYFVHLRSS